MSSAVTTSTISELRGRLDDLIEELLTVPLVPADDEEVLALWRSLETARRRQDAVEFRLIEETTARGIPGAKGCANAKVFLRQLLTITPAQADLRVKNAAAFGPRRDIQQIPLQPVFPIAAEAVTEGAITAQAARSIQQAIEKLPDEITATCGHALEQHMVDYARTTDSLEAAKFAHQLAYALDQDGQLKDSKKTEKRRSLVLRRRPDGTAHIEIEANAQLAELIATILDATAAPAPATDGTPDPRTPEQRNHDGLLLALQILLCRGDLHDTAGCRTTVVLRGDADDFARDQGTMTTGHGYPVPTEIAKRWLEPEARAILVLLSKTKGIQAYSSVQRLFTEQQRLAMHARDLGCAFPDCDRPAAWTQAHHVIEWHDSQHTRVDEGALICGQDHRTFEQLGWTNIMHHGRPAWIPPAWIDQHQQPRINTRHQPPDLTPPE